MTPELPQVTHRRIRQALLEAFAQQSVELRNVPDATIDYVTRKVYEAAQPRRSGLDFVVIGGGR